jgi:HK97 family phage prohead protease/HK97 family phage major capsid protein
MVNKDKLLKLCIPLETKQEGDEKELIISGHASTNDEDRSGDVIVTDAWRKPAALKNYLKNPIVLAFHDMSRPIGKTIGHEVDDKGLKITAKISKAAGNIRDLIKEGIVSAFSVGFMIKDADFNSDSGIFVIKDVELYEVSVVSIPANQNALFNIEKNFSDPEEYEEFKKQFIKESEETLMVDKAKEDKVEAQPIDIASLAKEISGMVKSDLAAEQKAAEEAKKAKEEEEAKIAATATTAAERMVKDLREELVEKEGTLAEALEGMRDLLKKQQEEGELQKAFTAENKGKMSFEDSPAVKAFDQNTRFGLLYASKLLNKPIHELDTFKSLVTKSGGEHWDSTVADFTVWEEEYSTTVQNAMREQLVIEPLFTTLPMSTPTMNMPINPEAGDATWVHEGSYRSTTAPWDESGDGTDTSTGAAQDHQIQEQTLVARKLATREYIGYEEEEDSIVSLAPIISDAVSRRMARATDLALLRGSGTLTDTTSYDPITGLEGRGANTTDIDAAGGATWASDSGWSEDLIVDMRRNLGIYGLDPSALVLIASHDLYYELMKLPNFKTVDVLADRATIITGQVGSLFGVRVLVSQNFDNAAITTGTVGTTLGIMVRPSNFVLGNLRGIMTETDRDIINQKRVIVSSRRFAFNDIISGEATVNLQIAT